MSRKINYTDEPLKAQVIQDFLPPPEELAFQEEGGQGDPSRQDFCLILRGFGDT